MIKNKPFKHNRLNNLRAGERLLCSVDVLNLPLKNMNLLLKYNINSLLILCEFSQDHLKKIGISDRGVLEIKQKLDKIGLQLRQ